MLLIVLPLHQPVNCKAEVDLSTCSTVSYEKRDGIHGVSYIEKSGLSGWVPARQVRRGISRSHRSSHQTPSDCSSISEGSDSDTETEDLSINPNASVTFRRVNKVPGLFIKTRKTRGWTPIAARTGFRIN